jgi:hypothetical protein
LTFRHYGFAAFVFFHCAVSRDDDYELSVFASSFLGFFQKFHMPQVQQVEYA